MKPHRIAAHWQILIGMAAGVVAGFLAINFGGTQFVIDWIKPIGVIFIRLLKLVAVPMIITSLVTGIAGLGDITRLSTMGLRTVMLYLATTVCAITVGLAIVNVVKPGDRIDEATRTKLVQVYSGDASAKIQVAQSQQQQGPLQPMIDLVPENVFSASTSNRNMLQVIFVVVFFGIGLLLVTPEHQAPIKTFFEALNAVVMKAVDMIMVAAPYGVFALLASLVVEVQSPALLTGLLWYSGCVVAGLAFMVFCFYPTLVIAFTKKRYSFFSKGILPAQLLAFSTSSSAATLPVTLECVEENLGVDNEVCSFVLPVGATVNMDGTSLYQAVAAVFIAQAFGMNLDLNQQLTIVLTATLASIGSAAVPGAGMVMLVIVLGAIGVPEQGLALIFAVDRILDMCRTTVNVTGDAAVCMLVGQNHKSGEAPN